MSIVERHPKLLKCVEHLFTENADIKKACPKCGEVRLETKRDAITKKDTYKCSSCKWAGEDARTIGSRLISNLKLSGGQCAALCYIMGCSASDGEKYRDGKPAPREKGLNWQHYETAKLFFSMLGSHPHFEAVRMALGKLVESDGELARKDDPDNPGLGGRLVEKLAILAKAWGVWRTDQRAFTQLDLQEGGCLYLHYTKPEWKEVKKKEGDKEVTETKYIPAELVENAPDFGGIDCPEKNETKQKPMTKEELAKRAEEARIETARKNAEKIRNMRLQQAENPAKPKVPTGDSTATTKPVPPPPPAPPKLRGGIGN